MSFVDPASKNEFFNSNNIVEYINQYSSKLAEALSSIDPIALNEAFAFFQDVRKNNARIWVAGNGGSSAIADHFCCDFTKGISCLGKRGIRAHSLSSNIALFTAIANDFSYENVFSTQIKMHCEEKDLVILISSSGNSLNILKAAEFAKSQNLKTISFTGFSGGKLATITDVNLHINVNNYGIVEDAHQALMHCFAQFMS